MRRVARPRDGAGRHAESVLPVQGQVAHQVTVRRSRNLHGPLRSLKLRQVSVFCRTPSCAQDQADLPESNFNNVTIGKSLGHAIQLQAQQKQMSCLCISKCFVFQNENKLSQPTRECIHLLLGNVCNVYSVSGDDPVAMHRRSPGNQHLGGARSDGLDVSRAAWN